MKQLLSTILVVHIIISGYGQTPAIHIEKSGKGKPVFYLPGFTCPGAVWNETIQHVKGNHQNYVVSYAGFEGVAPIKMPWYETIKNEVVSYIRNNKLKEVSIIGHSMGGTLALDIASEIPDLVTNLIIVDGLPCMRDLMMPGVSADKIQYKNPYNDQLLKMNDSAFEKNAIMFSKGMTNNQDKVQQLTKWAKATDRETYVYGYTDLLKTDVRPNLSNIKANVLILGASFPSKDVVEKTFVKQFENLPNKTIEIAPDSRHFIFFDQPDWFYTQVNSFFKK